MESTLDLTDVDNEFFEAGGIATPEDGDTYFNVFLFPDYGTEVVISPSPIIEDDEITDLRPTITVTAGVVTLLREDYYNILLERMDAEGMGVYLIAKQGEAI